MSHRPMHIMNIHKVSLFKNLHSYAVLKHKNAKMPVKIGCQLIYKSVYHKSINQSIIEEQVGSLRKIHSGTLYCAERLTSSSSWLRANSWF